MSCGPQAITSPVKPRGWSQALWGLHPCSRAVPPLPPCPTREATALQLHPAAWKEAGRLWGLGRQCPRLSLAFPGVSGTHGQSQSLRAGVLLALDYI